MNQWHKTSRGKFHRNMVIKIKQFDLTRVQDGCYPGAVEGEIIGGPRQGQSIWISMNKTSSNGNVARFEDIVKPEARNHTPSGGYLAFSSIRENNGVGKANWVNKFADSEAEIRAGVPIQISPVIEMGGGIRRFKSNNATMYRAFVLNTHEATTMEELAGLQEPITTIFAKGQAAFLTLVAPNEPRDTIVAWRGWNDGEPNPLDQAVLNAIAEPNHSKFEYYFHKGGKIDVVPLESIFVSPGAAESIDNGVFANIAIRDYSTGGIGGRIEAVLKQSKNLDTVNFEKFFLMGLDKHAKGAFTQYGWNGVWTSDIVKFFRDLDIELPRVPMFGYSLSNAAIKRFANNNGQESLFLTKSRSIGPTVSREYVPTPSDEGSIARYYDEFRDLVAQAITNINKKKELTKETGLPGPRNDSALTKVFDNTPEIGNSEPSSEKTP